MDTDHSRDVRIIQAVPGRSRERGAWVNAVENRRDYTFGRMSFGAKDVKKYPIQVNKFADTCKMEYVLFSQVVGQLSFPGHTNSHA